MLAPCSLFQLYMSAHGLKGRKDGPSVQVTKEMDGSRQDEEDGKVKDESVIGLFVCD